ncbi:MAG TPA: NAD+ synthase [Actinomycetota bacterium]|nr:NAD+ synthase [Actinomycetota bacterium]
MATIRVALAQINPTVGDLRANTARAGSAIAAARAAGADLVALPELAITGYPPEDLVLRPAFVGDNLAALSALAATATGIAAVVGFVDRDGDRLYNAAALLAEGRVQAVYHKHQLPNYGVFDEKRYFTAGEAIVVSQAAGVRFGITVCEDLWDPDGPHVACAAAGAQLIVNINGSPYERGKGGARQELLATRARELGVGFAYVNTIGGQDELVFDGQSLAVAADGTLIARGVQFAEDLVVFDYTPGDYTPGDYTPRDYTPGGPPEAAVLAREMEPAEEVYSALVLGVGDYLRKNGFRAGACIGLSGGIDSSLTAAIAADALGPEAVLGVLEPSEFTSAESIDYAEALAAMLGIATVTLPIGDVQEAFLKALSPVFAGTEWGLPEENLQARIRGTILMAISNKSGRIVLSTGNKSELSTGYATLYGDMAGGFAVLKDVPKTLVYELSRWRNRRRAVIPEEVLARPPTAELRHNQLDSDSLPPYEILDPILEAYVEDDRSQEEIVALGFPAETVWRVVQLVDRAEYKRRQAPPGVKITRRAFGRDRRPPITNQYHPGPPQR